RKLRVATVSSVDAARLVVEDEAPAVILLEESAVNGPPESGIRLPLDTVVSTLAGYAPVVVLGDEERPAELDAIGAAGAADYNGKKERRSQAAGEAVQRRLRQAQEMEENLIAAKSEVSVGAGVHAVEDFGQVLRHELNNPLTGILGNAELLLSEIKRKN